MVKGKVCNFWHEVMRNLFSFCLFESLGAYFLEESNYYGRGLPWDHHSGRMPKQSHPFPLCKSILTTPNTHTFPLLSSKTQVMPTGILHISAWKSHSQASQCWCWRLYTWFPVPPYFSLLSCSPWELIQHPPRALAKSQESASFYCLLTLT